MFTSSRDNHIPASNSGGSTTQHPPFPSSSSSSSSSINNNKKRVVRSLYSEFGELLKETFSYKSELDKKFRIREALIREKNNEHANENLPFYWLRAGDYDKLKRELRRDPTLVNLRDAVGASIIHVAYLLERYDIGRWLVEQYPDEGLLHYSDVCLTKDPSTGEPIAPKGYMPYSGENILHMTIIRRNKTETKWLLNFYRNLTSLEFGLVDLLTACTTGTFFDRAGSFYFGGFPLMFAVCCNDTEIFDLVLEASEKVDTSALVIEPSDLATSPTSSTATATAATTATDTTAPATTATAIAATSLTSSLASPPSSSSSSAGAAAVDQPQSTSSSDRDRERRRHSIATYGRAMLGADAIFIRDEWGNTALHMCVFHSLKDMYKHVYKRAIQSVKRSIENRTLVEGEPFKLSEIHSVFNSLNVLWREVDEAPRRVYALKESEQTMPSKPHYQKWLNDVSTRKVDERMTLSLNVDCHSPFTLAAAKEVVEEGEAALEKAMARKANMLKFLIQEMKMKRWSYGPVSVWVLELEGIDMIYNRDLYAPSPPVDREMYGAIEWLCLTNSHTCFTIPEIKRIVETKWDRCGQPEFLPRFVLHILVTTLLTLLVCCINGRSAMGLARGRVQRMSDYFILLLYPLTSLALLVVAYSELRFCYSFWESHQHFSDGKKGLSWIFSHVCMFFYGFGVGIRGAALFDKFSRLVVLISFTVHCLLKAQAMHNCHYLSESFMETVGAIDGNTCGGFSGAAGGSSGGGVGGDVLAPVVDDVAFKISLSISVMMSWASTYYYMMGPKATGPFVLSIYRVVSKDIPFFMTFYVVLLFAFACSLSMLTERGDSDTRHGFEDLAISFWMLFKYTVGFDSFAYKIDASHIPTRLVLIFDVLLTMFYSIVVLILLNLMIAMISNTYSSYIASMQSFILMEKYNIMCAMQRSMGGDERYEFRLKFAIVHEKNRLAIEFEEVDPNWWDSKGEQQQQNEVVMAEEKRLLHVINSSTATGGTITAAPTATTSRAPSPISTSFGPSTTTGGTITAPPTATTSRAPSPISTSFGPISSLLIVPTATAILSPPPSPLLPATTTTTVAVAVNNSSSSSSSGGVEGKGGGGDGGVKFGFSLVSSEDTTKTQIQQEARRCP